MLARLPIIIILLLEILITSRSPLGAQQVMNDQQPAQPSIGQLLNRIDKPSAWSSAGSYSPPASSAGPAFQNTSPNMGRNPGYSNGMAQMGSSSGFQPGLQPGFQSNNAQPGWQAPQYPSQQSQIGQTQWQGNGVTTNVQTGQPQQLMQVNGQPTMRALFPGIFNPQPAQATQAQAPAGNPFSPQNILKVFMGGGDAPKDPQQALSQAREDLQTARDQCSQARGDASSVNGTRERDSKQSYAESARYHAQAAREAADRAWNCAQSSGSSQVNDVASQARGAADEAQAAADRATANASGGGW